MVKSKRQKQQTFKACAALICCAVLFFALVSSCFTAGAMNVDYMEPQKWAENSAVKRVALDCTNIDRNLKGDFYYLTDGKLCIYTYFKITETTLGEADEVYVTYEFHTEDENYTVVLGKDGFEKDSPKEERKLFKISTNFIGGGKYLSAVQYTGKDFTKCTVDITLNVNGRVYSITGNKEIYGKPVKMELETATRAQTTKKKAPEKKKTKKGKKKKKAAKKSKKAKSESTTKFHPSYSITTTAKADKAEAESETAGAVQGEITQNANEDITREYLGDTEGEMKMSDTAKWLLIIAAIIAAAGLGVLCTVLVMKKDDKKDEEKTDDE